MKIAPLILLIPFALVAYPSYASADDPAVPPAVSSSNWSLSAGLEPSYDSLRGIHLGIPFWLQYRLSDRWELGVATQLLTKDTAFLLGFGAQYRVWQMTPDWGLLVGLTYLHQIYGPGSWSQSGLVATVGLDYRISSAWRIEPYVKVHAISDPAYNAGVRVKFDF